MRLRNHIDAVVAVAIAAPIFLALGSAGTLASVTSLGTLAVVMILVLVIGVPIGWWLCSTNRATSGDEGGMATGSRHAKHMSRRAMARTAARTRPSLPLKDAKPTDYGFVLGRSTNVTRREMFASLEDVVMVYGRPRSRKTGRLGNYVIDAAGATVTTSTRVDIYRHTVRLISDHPVYCFNPRGLGGIPSNFRWNPIAGCRSPDVAISRAGYFLAGASDAHGSEDRDFWQSNNCKVLSAYLHAADIAGATMEDLYRWVTSDNDNEAMGILENSSSEDSKAFTLAASQILSLHDKTRGSVFASLSLTFMFMTNPVLASCVMPRPGDMVFDTRTFLRQRASLFLLAEKQPHAALNPLFTALTGTIWEEAKATAACSPSDRLDPPLTWILDEAASICPAPLERWTAEAGGWGMPMLIAVQGESQLEETWGKNGARTIQNNAGYEVLLPGCKDVSTLERFSKLCGEKTVRNTSWTHGADGKRSKTVSRSKVPVMPIEAIKNLDDPLALVVPANKGPIIVRSRMVWDRPDYKASPTGPLTDDPPLVSHRQSFGEDDSLDNVVPLHKAVGDDD